MQQLILDLKNFKEIYKEIIFLHFTTHSKKQANYVERFIKTIKGRIWRHITATNSRRYIDILPKLVDSYNKSWHTGIHSEPRNVTKDNESKLWWQMHWPKFENNKLNKNKKSKSKILFAFKVGDKVRISYLCSSFQREYDVKWSGEMFKISKRFLRQGQPMCKIVGWLNQPMKGTFYQKELQKANITRDDIQKIDKIVKYKGRGKNRQALVHWLNWPKKFDSWILASEIKGYNL